MQRLKRTLGLLLALALVISCFGSALAAGNAAEFLQVTTQQTGSTLTMTILTTLSTRSGQMTVSYDTTYLTYEGISSTATISSVDDSVPGVLDFGFACTQADAFSAGSTVATLTFTVLTGSQVPTVIAVAPTSMEDGSGNEVILADEGEQPPVLNAPTVLNSVPGSTGTTGGAVGGGGSASAPAYIDVPFDAWYSTAVYYVSAQGYFNGTSATAFSPNVTMNRAMFVTVLGRMAGVTPTGGAATGFTDVDPDSFYAGYVKWGVESGVVKGTSATTFSPEAPVSREMMAAFLYRFAQYRKMDTTANADAFHAFTDASTVHDWAQAAMIWATHRGLIQGTRVGIEPLKTADRAQTAQIIMRFDLLSK